MEHFAKSVDGWFYDGDFQFYKFAINHLRENIKHVVEVGSYKGRSSSFMAVELSKLDRKVIFDCVDTWQGSEEHQDIQTIIDNKLFEEFQKNMEPVKDFYNTKRMTSLDAAKLYEDNSLDMVFIDASHDYENVKQDILAWEPKVKMGGIISGHDYQPCWSGVIKAVNEIIKNPTVFPNSTSWYKIKT